MGRRREDRNYSEAEQLLTTGQKVLGASAFKLSTTGAGQEIVTEN